MWAVTTKPEVGQLDRNSYEIQILFSFKLLTYYIRNSFVLYMWIKGTFSITVWFNTYQVLFNNIVSCFKQATLEAKWKVLITFV